MQARIAVLSDLHCHPTADVPHDSFLLSDGDRIPDGWHPIQSLLTLVRTNGLSADVVAVPGDLTNKVSRQGLHSAWQFVHEVAEALGARFVATTVGNHDVDSRLIHGPDAFKIPRDSHPDFPAPAPYRDHFWGKNFYIRDVGETRVVVLNTVAYHRSESEAKRGKITEIELNLLRKELSDLPKAPFQICVLHHHPIPHEALGLGADDLLEGGELLVSLLGDFGFQLVVHGHKHHPSIRCIPETPVVVFAAGSLAHKNSEGLASNTRNLFHIVTLDASELDGCTSHGVIESWEFNLTRGWNRPNMQSACIPHIAGFGCLTRPEELARLTAERFHSTKGDVGFVKWARVLEYLPQTRYMTPRQFERYAEILLLDHSIDLVPKAPDQPKYLGLLLDGGE